MQMPTIGVLWGGEIADVSQFRDAFQHKLRDLGKVEGQHIAIEERYIKGSDEAVQDLVDELITAGANVIVTSGTPSTRAARDRTNIPIIFVAVGDPSLVTGSNVTGVHLAEPALSVERLRKLTQAFDGVRTVAVLRNLANPVHQVYFQAMRDAAPGMGITTLQPRDSTPLSIEHPGSELDGALDTLAQNRPDALVVLPDASFHSQRSKIMRRAIKERVPAMYSQRSYVEQGGLMSYGPNYTVMFQQAAGLVNRILDVGTIPSTEPVGSLELVINVNTARRIGCHIHDSVLAEATLID